MSAQSTFSIVLILIIGGAMLMTGGYVIDIFTMIANNPIFLSVPQSQLHADVFNNMVSVYRFMPFLIMMGLFIMHLNYTKANAEVPLGDMISTTIMMIIGYVLLMAVELFAVYALDLVVSVTGNMNLAWDSQYPVIQLILTLIPFVIFYGGLGSLVLVFLAKCIGYSSYTDAF